MSDPRTSPGIVSGPFVAAAEALAKHQALPPDKKNANRAYTGAFLLGATGYIAFGPELSGFPDEWKLGLAGAACFGLLLVVVGWRGARGARDPLAALFAVAVPIGGFVAVAKYAPELLSLPYAHAFCAGVAVANLVRFWLAIRGPGIGNAQNLVRQEIAENVIEWRAVKRRR
jgi:hypothetical protein